MKEREVVIACEGDSEKQLVVRRKSGGERVRKRGDIVRGRANEIE
jgi:hypothetical protein